MNKYVLASIAVLIAGATASTAIAAERRTAGEPSLTGAVAAVAKGPLREEREETREERREESREERDVRRDDRGGGEAGDSRREHRPDVRLSPPVASTPVQTQHRDWNRDRGDDDDQGDSRGWSRDRDAGDHDSNRDRDYDGRDWNRDRDDGNRDWSRDDSARSEWRNDRHDWRSDDRRDNRYYTRYRDSRWSGYNWYPQYRYRASTRYIYPYGYRPNRWTVGYRMPYAFYSPRSYWLDWQMYRLPPPPYGYQWVRVDRDVVLVSMASGYIRDVLYGVFW